MLITVTPDSPVLSYSFGSKIPCETLVRVCFQMIAQSFHEMMVCGVNRFQLHAVIPRMGGLWGSLFLNECRNHFIRWWFVV